MRILGVSKKWDKLRRPDWTTFRFARKDKDWYEGEVVQVYYKPRSKDREFLGRAKIVKKERRWFGVLVHPYYISNTEARIDGFKSNGDMALWFREQYGARIFSEPMNRLTLEWVHPSRDLVKRCLEADYRATKKKYKRGTDAQN